MTVIEGQEVFEKEYPSFAAVNRAANGKFYSISKLIIIVVQNYYKISVIPRHRGRIIKLEYNPASELIENTLFLVGKGMTYDTGGADIKTSGYMTGYNFNIYLYFIIKLSVYPIVQTLKNHQNNLLVCISKNLLQLVYFN
jgi:hypothetical protein